MSYKVKKGDTLSKIAKENNLSLDELLELNGISKDKANHILIGQEIKVTKDQNSANSRSVGFKSPYPSIINLKSYFNNDKPISAPFKEGYTEDDYKKDHAESIQLQLKKAGYNLGASGKNKDGVDGKWGKNSQAALDKALSEGYKLENGKLIAPKKLISKTTKPQPTGTDNIAYVNLEGYKAFGVLPTGHAGVIVRDASGMNTYYDFGAKHTSKSGFTRMNDNTSGQNTDYRKVELGRNLSDEELGAALGKYFPDNDNISFYWKSGDDRAATQYMQERAQTNYDNYNSLTNNCSSEAECAMEAAGIKFDGLIPSIDVPAWNTPKDARHYQWSRTSSDEEMQKRKEFEEALQQQTQEAQMLYDSEYKGKTPEEIRQIALARSRDKNAKPNTNFMTASDMFEEKRMKASRNATNSYSNCINTITGFFNPTQTVSSNISFTQTPSAYGFEEISEADAQPGDVGILHNTTQHPYHAVILDNKAEDGSWNLNYSNGDNAYRHNRNIKAFDAAGQKHKLGSVKYYRYVGNNDTFVDKATRAVAPGLRFLRSIVK